MFVSSILLTLPPLLIHYSSHSYLSIFPQLDSESLMRVYGALLWSMGRIFKGAEVSRIYVGSFRDEVRTGRRCVLRGITHLHYFHGH